MYTTYHLTSAQEASTDILDAIKAAFKSKPITITVEQDDSGFGLSADMKAVLDERLQEDESTYLTAEESINQLKKKYGLLKPRSFSTLHSQFSINPERSDSRFSALMVETT